MGIYSKIYVLFLLCLNDAFAIQIDFTAQGIDGLTVQFLDASGYEDDTQHSYLWDFGDGEISIEQNPVHTYVVEGVYTVCLSVDGLPSICKEDTFYVSESGLRVKYDDTVWPNGEVSEVSSPFGPRWKQSDARYDFHRGIDIPGNSGDPIVSMADGVVHSAYIENDPDSPFSSTVVVIAHTMETPIVFHGKFITRYYSISSHMNRIADDIQEGVVVQKGDFIGTVGQTGDTSFDHNHFEIRLGIICSRESQRGGGCSSSPVFDEIVDPHVNPLLFLDYGAHDTNSLTYEILQENPVQIKVVSDRPEIDFNRIEIISNTERKTLDINLRDGIDPDDIDGNPYDGLGIEAGFYTAQGDENYELTLTFDDFNAVDAILVSDIWGNTSGIPSPNEENGDNEDNEGDEEDKDQGPILMYSNPVSDIIAFNKLPESGQLLYQIFDVQGALVKKGTLSNTIPVDNLSVGLYYLRLWNMESGNGWFFKVLKK